MKYLTKFLNTYQVNYDGIVENVHGMPSHYFLAHMARIFNVPLERVRVKFLGYICVFVPLYKDDDLPF